MMGSGRAARWRIAITGAALLAASASHAQTIRKPPYFASISATQARMRTGPGRNYPAAWLYQRKGLPIRVIETYPGWRKIEDPDGTQGWMQANLLTEKRTGMVRGGIAELHESASAGGRVLWRAAPGVIGALSRCSGGWCWFDVKGRSGYVEATQLWGVGPDEAVD